MELPHFERATRRAFLRHGLSVTGLLAGVRDRFDLVGFDPRGVGRSTALRCSGNLRQSTRRWRPFRFP